MTNIRTIQSVAALNNAYASKATEATVATHTAAIAAAAPVQETLISTGTLGYTEGSFGLPIRYTDTNRRLARVKNTGTVNLEVTYGTLNSQAQPSWGAPTVVVPGGEFYDENVNNPLWIRSSDASGTTVAYYFELGV